MYVYVLKSQKDGSFYVGATNDLRSRVISHNKGYNAATKTKLPWQLVRSEEFKDAALALKRERFLKSSRGRAVLRNIILGEQH